MKTGWCDRQRWLDWRIIAKFIERYRAGRLPLDVLITKRYALDDLAQAFADMEAGHVGRGVIVF